MTEATLSAKNQIVIPREARKALGLKPGDKILVVVRGEKVLVLQKPKSHRVAMRGMARGIYAADMFKRNGGIGARSGPIIFSGVIAGLLWIQVCSFTSLRQMPGISPYGPNLHVD